MTCKLFANDVRTCRHGLKVEQRFAELEMSIAEDEDNNWFWCGRLQRAPCPVVDLTGLKINFNFYGLFSHVRSHPTSYCLVYLLWNMFKKRPESVFGQDTTQLRDIEVCVRVNKLKGRYKIDVLEGWMDVFQMYFAALYEHKFSSKGSSLEHGGLRNMCLMEYTLRDDLGKDWVAYLRENFGLTPMRSMP